MNKTPKATPSVDEARLRQQAIGSRLRQLFDEVVNEPVPDDFLDILRRAEAGGGHESDSDSADDAPRKADGSSAR